MDLRTLTVANSVFALSVTGLFNAPVVLDGYSADGAFAADAVQTAEARMGVDGRLAAGYTPNPTKMKVNLEASSLSVDIFEQWAEAQRTAREIYFADATIDLPALGKSFTLTKGVLTMNKTFPDAKKTLAPVEYEITWESISPNFI